MLVIFHFLISLLQRLQFYICYIFFDYFNYFLYDIFHVLKLTFILLIFFYFLLLKYQISFSHSHFSLVICNIIFISNLPLPFSFISFLKQIILSSINLFLLLNHFSYYFLISGSIFIFIALKYLRIFIQNLVLSSFFCLCFDFISWMVLFSICIFYLQYLWLYLYFPE